MSVADSIRNAIPPINREGYKFIAAFFLGSLVLGWIWEPLFWIGLALTVWCALFFRDPARVTPVSASLVVSPADGRVSLVGPARPPLELGLGTDERIRVSVFMNVFDVHVNRAPVTGRVVKMAYRPGKFVNAELDKASEDNERNGIVLERDDGRKVGVVQIAGLVARRIVPWVREGESVIAGDRIGMIRFGSRLDVYLPEGATPMVAVGQKSVAGETIIADLDGHTPAPVVRIG